MSTFVIAEVGVNHNGSTDLAIELIDIAVDIGANAVKFQTFTASKLASSDAAKADYQVTQTGVGGQLEMLAGLELSPDDHDRLIRHCEARGIEFMSTPFDLDSADFLASAGVKRLKLPSGDIDNLPMLRKFAQLSLPVIVSTGMADMAEVLAAKMALEAEWNRAGTHPGGPDALTILHCTSNYPTELQDVNLLAMRTMADTLECPVGYSDHTEDIFVAVAAVALGATVIEKHITLDRTMAGPDHAASLDPDRFAEMIRHIRGTEYALGDGIKQPRASEAPVRAVARRSIAAARDIAPGTVIKAEDLIMLRPSGGISPMALDDVVGQTAASHVDKGALLLWNDLEECEKSST